jgi:hypothetical protein
MIEADEKENFGIRYDEPQSLKLHKYAFLTSDNGKLLSLKFGGRTRRFQLLNSEGYDDFKRAFATVAYDLHKR